MNLLHIFVVCSEIDTNVQGLKQFTTSMFVEATARCLHAIDSSIDVPYRLPPSMAAQFRIGANIATAVQVETVLNAFCNFIMTVTLLCTAFC